ncbi:hypothetical protein GLW05_09880 [Pontibacillus yanchengensis]|uniref:Metallophosphoesterase n=1 Tax=Pontibacillus yanchengensis TaxID=462910 RepID=A0A6I4ZUR1_9BACI|nr:metallophosphoesterase family protein [Pontibacillus yanchengensis]MYL33908.1 hypothetical protein [Pontibacillus yanchengensis]
MKRFFVMMMATVMVAGTFFTYHTVQAAEESLGGETPEHLTLTWTDSPKTTQNFTWRTSTDVTESVVQIVETSNYDGSFDSSEMVENTGDSFTFESDEGAMQVHEAKATALEPGTSYMYRVGNGQQGGWSDAASFTTEAGGDKPFTFLFTTDTQSAASTNMTWGYGIWGDIFDKALTQYPNARFMLLSGDIVDRGDEQIHWENWFKAAQQQLPTINMVPTMGNHDVYGTGEKNFAAQFQLPENGPEGEKEFAYSFDYSNVHIAVLNSEGDLQKQAEWLKQDMAASDKQWNIVSFHRSPYHSHPDRASLDVRHAWTPVFDEAGVDLVLSGHDHAYMRSYPLYDGEKVNQDKGTTYIIGGSAGPKFYEMGNQPWMKVKFDQDKQIYSGVTVDGNELQFNVTANDGETVDAFTMVKEEPFAGMNFTEWGENLATNDQMKTWSISLNTNIDGSALKADHVQVKKSNAEQVDVSLAVENSNTLTVTPKEPYEPGTYYMMIDQNLPNETGKALKNNVRAEFQVE